MDFENKQPETWEQAALFRAKAKEEICARLECLESFKWVEVVFRKINMNTSGIILLGKFRFQDAKGEYAIKRFVYEGWSGQLFIEDMESNSALENAWAFYRPEEIKFSTPPSYNYPRGGDPHMGIYNLNPYGVGPRLYNPPIRIIPRR